MHPFRSFLRFLFVLALAGLILGALAYNLPSLAGQLSRATGTNASTTAH